MKLCKYSIYNTYGNAKKKMNQERNISSGQIKNLLITIGSIRKKGLRLKRLRKLIKDSKMWIGK
jgi:hypothetical protein